jgi:nucleoside 2-deoxyribosyltransferase
MKTVYLAGPIENLSYDNATSWREFTTIQLQDVSIQTRNPMRHKLHLKKSEKIVSHEHFNAKEIIDRDRADVSTCDLILVNFMGTNHASVGTFVELGWADMLRIPVIAVMDDNDPKRNHPFIKSICSVIVNRLDDGIDKVKEFLL